VPPEGVVHALGQMIEAVEPGGLVLDLQVTRPDPPVVLDGRVIATIDAELLFAWADAATAAVDARIAAGELVEEAVDDHEIRTHDVDGAALVDDLATSTRRRLADAVVPVVAAIDRPLVVRERCRLRRLRVADRR
jgi:hypothetical protein